MTALDFPANPTNGQEYNGYIWNATKGVWDSNSGLDFNITDLADVDTTGVVDGNALVYDGANSQWIPGEGSGGGSYTVSATVPAEPGDGDVWFDSTDGLSYIYYNDGDTSQWIEIGNQTVGPQGPAGPAGTNGTDGTDGVDGEGVALGGTSGQVLAKASSTDFDTEWVDISTSLSGLSDTNISSPSDGQALVYSESSSQWVPGSAAPSGMNIQPSDSVAIDFSDNVPFEKRVVSGDIVFTGSSYSEGITKQILLEGDSLKRNLTFPAGWNFVNNDKPVSIGVNKDNLLSLYSFGTSESNVIATWEGESSFEPIQATGGTETEVLIGNVTYKLHTFNSTDTFIVSDPGTFGEVEYLIVAGGGGGGAGTRGGGGGAGGLLTSVAGESSGGGANASNTYNVTATNYPILVGSGGTTSTYSSDNGARGGQNGSNSSFAGIIAIGGGGGGHSDSSGTNKSPKSGGSGGGGWYAQGAGGAGTAGQGYAGGTSSTTSPYGAGGGGAGEVGGNALSGQYGGDGVTSSITGNTLYYAGGGSSAPYDGATGGTAGLGGGGTGNNSSSPGVAANGVSNTGGGGGAGGVGGSGVVIIRYPITDPN